MLRGIPLKIVGDVSLSTDVKRLIISLEKLYLPKSIVFMILILLKEYKSPLFSMTCPYFTIFTNLKKDFKLFEFPKEMSLLFSQPNYK